MKKLNNKGFSLVELIIVIAIMAILVGVVGTQVIPYLENSRKAKDLQILSSWNTAAVSSYSTEAGAIDATETYTITIAATSNGIKNKSGKTDANDNACKRLLATFKSLTDMSTLNYDWTTMSSKAGKAITGVEIKIDGKTGWVVTKVTGYNDSKYNDSFDVIENK